jgi:hypothetical protein
VAVAALLGTAYVSAAQADDAPPPPATTTPSPDPAPPLPQPKPAAPPKPAAKPARVYHAPVQPSAPAPAPRPAYRPPPVVHHVTKKVVRHTRAHARPHKARRVVTVPKVHAQVKHAAVVHVSGVPAAAIATNGSEVAHSPVVISGIVLAALLFLLVVTVPSTAARYTAPGRVLMDHQTQLVLAGVALLLVAALLFALAGNG